MPWTGKNISHTHLNKRTTAFARPKVNDHFKQRYYAVSKSKSIIGMLSYVTPDFTALMVLGGYNKKLRPCELVQTAATGCSWELQAPFRIFFFFIPFSGCFIQSVMTALCCDGLKRLWAWVNSLCFANPVSFEKTCVTTGSLLKYSWSSTTGTAVGSDMHWLNGEPTQLSGVWGRLEMEM